MTTTTAVALTFAACYLAAALTTGLTLHLLSDALADYEAHKARADGDDADSPLLPPVDTPLKKAWPLYAAGMAWPLLPLVLSVVRVRR